ncbi:MAG: peptide-methionine (S)-S-oxide reductase MsrA [Archaeoglobaceae archaeon]
MSGNYENATFAGGCFWCMEAAFKELDGVIEVVSGYTGGHMDNPTYNDVLTGKTGHYEAIQVTYDPSKVSYTQLLKVFWRNIDPIDPGGQFADRGPQYRTAIFYHNEDQKRLAEDSKKELEESGKFDKPIATKIIQYKRFYRAEEYHQDYYKKQPGRYSTYSYLSGRKPYIKKVWGVEDE